MENRTTRMLLFTLACVVGLNLVDLTGKFIIVVILTIVLLLALCASSGEMLPSHGKAVVITGCDTGIGNNLARHLHSLGFRVYAGCLFKDGKGAQKLEEDLKERIVIVQMDVTKEKEVVKAFEIIKEHLTSTKTELWGVVNNAGINIVGEIEWLDTELLARVSDVNLWGMVRVVKAAVPLLRASQGRIVNIGSGCGLISFPLNAAYCVSKYGIESFTDVLRLELAKWMIKVVLIEPGNFGPATNLFTEQNIKSIMKKVKENMTEDVEQTYGHVYFDSISNYLCEISKNNSGSSDISPVIHDVTEALLIERPRHRYKPGTKLWNTMVYMHSVLPSTLTDLLYYKSLNDFSKNLKCKKI